MVVIYFLPLAFSCEPVKNIPICRRSPSPKRKYQIFRLSPLACIRTPSTGLPSSAAHQRSISFYAINPTMLQSSMETSLCVVMPAKLEWQTNDDFCQTCHQRNPEMSPQTELQTKRLALQIHDIIVTVISCRVFSTTTATRI
jgi:hypothetical protein